MPITGQNGLQQAQKFNDTLDLDGVIVTKLDGTAKGGIALGEFRMSSSPIFKIGVGEGIDDLQDFDAHDFARALIEIWLMFDNLSDKLQSIFRACAARVASLKKISTLPCVRFAWRCLRPTSTSRW